MHFQQSVARAATAAGVQFCIAHVCLASLSNHSRRLNLKFHPLHTCINNIAAVVAQELMHESLQHSLKHHNQYSLVYTCIVVPLQLANTQSRGCGVPLKPRRKHFGARGTSAATIYWYITISKFVIQYNIENMVYRYGSFAIFKKNPNLW